MLAGWGRRISLKDVARLANVQTVCSPAGELLWAAAPQPGATVDVTAARKAGIAAILTSLIGVFADLGISAGTRR